MKKTISILLALTMLFALCVPSFAKVKTDTPALGKTTINHEKPFVKDPQEAEGDIVVDGTVTGAENYTVEFDATNMLTWGNTTAQNVTYSYKCQLKPENRLHITVANNGDNTLKPDASLTDASPIPYVLGGNVNVTSVHANEPAAVVQNATITVADWSQAPLGKYTDTLTFTVDVVTPAP